MSVASRIGQVSISLAFIALACQSVPPAHEAERATQVEAPVDADGVVVVERLLEVRIADQPVGVVESRLEKAPDGTWTSSELMTLSMIREGGGPEAQFSSTTQSVAIYDANHELVSEVETEREAGVTITRTVVIEGDELVSSYVGPGQPERQGRFALPEDYRSSLAAEFELVREWEQTGEVATLSFASFSTHRERFERTELSLTGAIMFEHGGEQIPAWTFRARHEDGASVDTILDHDFMALSYDAGGTFVASLVDVAPDLALAKAGRINSELPVLGLTTSRWHELAEQKITVTVEGDDDPDAPGLWEDNHYHRVEREGERYAMTLLSTRPGSSFRAPKLPLDIDDAQIRRFLEPTPMSQSDNPNIVARAAAIVDGETDSLRAAQKIVAAVFEGLDKRAGVRGSATASEVLQNGAGDCTEHAVLVVALMRAAGIPARVIDGVVFASDRGGQGMAGYHAWAEIWLGQWIGVDATVDETGTSARYLQFGVDEPGMPGSNGKMMRSIGKTKIELGPHLTYEELRPAG